MVDVRESDRENFEKTRKQEKHWFLEIYQDISILHKRFYLDQKSGKYVFFKFWWSQKLIFLMFEIVLGTSFQNIYNFWGIW